MFLFFKNCKTKLLYKPCEQITNTADSAIFVAGSTGTIRYIYTIKDRLFVKSFLIYRPFVCGPSNQKAGLWRIVSMRRSSMCSFPLLYIVPDHVDGCIISDYNLQNFMAL
jgi:hypothetical protein